MAAMLATVSDVAEAAPLGFVVGVVVGFILSDQDTWDEYTQQRKISDWPGANDTTDARRMDARHWILDRMEYIADCAYGEVDGKEPGWNVSNRRARYDFLATYNSGDPVRICHLPREGANEAEDFYILERGAYWNIQPLYDAQGKRKQTNFDWLEERRKYVWNCAEGNVDNVEAGWDISNRRDRYDNLQVATRYGSAYQDWLATHDYHSGNELKPDQPAAQGWRDKSSSWHGAHLGITESPPNSNCDSRSDGIRTSQDGCANGTWLRYQAWCGCWAWSGLYAAGKVRRGDSWLASVAAIEDAAKAGRTPFKGWTTDGSKARKGDLVVLFGRGQHVGTVREVDADYCHTWEGNTSSGSGGSQSNGGGSYKRSRSRHSETYGYALVRD
jgi:hypothetical protein